MSPGTDSSRDSSSKSAAAFDLTPEPSRLLVLWRVLVHGLACAGILASGLAVGPKLGALAAVLGHAALRPPPAPARLRRGADGLWSFPDGGGAGLALRPGTAVGPFWIRLRLGSAEAREVDVLLLEDQLDAESWRRLQSELRRSTPAGTV